MRALMLALAPVTLLAGCISFGAEPPPSLLTLTASAAPGIGTSRTAAAGQAVTILQPRAPAVLNTIRVPVTSGDTAIAYVKDAVWVEAPARLFRDLLSETVAAKTGRLVLDARQFNLDPGIVIAGELRNFGVDSDTREAVVTYDAARSMGEQVEERRFEARVPVSPVEAVPVGIALNSAANQVAEQVAAWIGG